jgi:class 3 adenylate cyclase/tetratricopeptide (TPR) repeat protein
VICASCGTENETGRKFCKECGSPLALVCGACGSANAADSKFCGECGASLSGAAPAVPLSTTSPGLAMERRLVSVLFADLVGSTALAEQRDAEDTRDLLNSYFDLAREAIEHHGGLVEKFVGDAVMAVWGTPVAHEDDAERAVRTALEILDAVDGLGLTIGAPLQARAAVVTGEAAATIGAVSQGIVAGDMVNTASRLQSAAEPGTVLVGEATFQAASRAIVFVRVGDIALKGKDEPVAAWRALRVVSERGGAGRSIGLEPPFVGRGEELRLVKDLLHVTGRERKVRLASVVGIGGIGKSRLAWEFLKYVDGLSENVYWHQGRCPAYGDGVTFWALGEMVRMRARIAETDTPAESRRKLSSTVEEYVADANERRWIEPRLAHLLGLDERPPGERDELFSAWRTFFDRIADRGPTVLVFEDLQWADPGLLDFVESMLEWSRNQPILVLTLSRPELIDRRPGWGAGQWNSTSLRLEPLGAEAMAHLVTGFVRGLPGEGIQRIVERSEGVPLYAVETVRMLADRGVLVQGQDAFELVGDLGDLDIPATLQALIAARLDALPAEDRSLLQQASVLGKSFTLDGLAAVSGSDRERLEPRLRDLARKEFLRQDTDPRSPERGQYGFLQALIREVAYGTLPKAERRRLHLATAHHLESLGDDELAGVVAAHYVEAFRATPDGPDAEALAARARDWLGNAADRATSLGSPEQALTFADQALEITADGPERAALLEQAGDAATKAALSERAVAYFEDAIAIDTRAGDVDAVGRVTAQMSRPFFELDRRKECVDRCLDALETLGDEGHEEARAKLFSAIAGASMAIGDLDRTIEYVELALPLLERLNITVELEEALTTKAGWLMSVGRHREAVMLFNGALAVADEIGDQGARADALLTLGVAVVEDSPRRALEIWLEGAEASRRAGVRTPELICLANAAEAAIEIGDWPVADDIIADLVGRPDLSGWRRQGLSLDRALLAAYRGRGDQANSILVEELAGLETTDHLMLRTWFLRVRAAIALEAGDLDGAFGLAMQSIADEPSGGNAPASIWCAARAALWQRDIARARTTRAAMDALRGAWIESCRHAIDAGIAALEGRPQEAAVDYERVLDAFDAMGTQLDRARCTIDAVTVLPRATLPDELLDWTRAYLEQLGARSLLDRLASVTGAAATIE